GVWPWHARAGTSVLAWWIRRGSEFAIHDLAPMRVCPRRALLDLDVRDRRFGYPLELMRKASAAGWTVAEVDICYRERAEGTRSKVSGSVRGTARVVADFAKVMADRQSAG
ncbi:MAG: glycosyltransferase, partial [Mycobacteriales bacterium]